MASESDLNAGWPYRVVLLMTDLSDFGVQRVVINLCNHFDRVRIEPILVFWNKHGRLAQLLKEAEPVYETDPGLPWPRFVFRLFRYARILRKLKPDLVLSFVPGTNVSYALLKPFMPKGIAFIVSENAFLSRAFATGEYQGPFKWLYRFMLRPMYNRLADCLVMVAHAAKRDAVDVWGIKANGIKVIYNPQDVAELQRQAAEEVQDAWFNESKPLVVGVGRLCVQKGFSNLLRSFCLLRRRLDARLVILGQGELEASLKSLAVDLGISQHVQFLGFQSNPLRYIRRASVFALSSIWEGMPMVVAETMVVGTPVVAFDCPSGPLEMLDAGRCGYLVPDQDVVAFADALYRALTNPAEAQSKAALAKTKAEEFEVTSIAGQYTDLIEQTIATKRQKRGRFNFWLKYDEGAAKKMVRINIGCGQTPTEGWRNFDNSLSLRLSKFLLLPTFLLKAGLLDKAQHQFMQFASANSIEYGDATKGLPIPDGSVDVLYSSHMLEHLDHEEVGAFLSEARRILRSGGIIRLAVPDIRKQIQQYLETNDADAFVAATHLTQPRPRTLSQRIKILLVGTRHHQWMYDGASLSRLLQAQGFTDTRSLEAGETRIANPQKLDLHERASESVYVEARKP